MHPLALASINMLQCDIGKPFPERNFQCTDRAERFSPPSL